MKILAIRGENLASLAEPFEVDLVGSALSRSGLFAITGAVGAGKSTLLDALCVALFDRTPRLAERGGVMVGVAGDEARLGASDVRGILRRGAGSGFAEVDFVGTSQRPMRARWEVRRARNRVDGRFQKQSMSLAAIDTGQPLGGSKTETLAAIERELGLTFEQFRRSVVLAQGEFATFLRTSTRDRAELLERMTDTAIYGELSVAAHRRATEVKQAIRLLEQERERVELLGDAARAELEAECARTVATVQRFESAVATLERLERAAKARSDQVTALEALRARVVSSTAAELEATNAVRSIEGAVDQHRAEQQRLRTEIDAARAADREVERLTAQRDADAASAERAASTYERGVKAKRRRRPELVADEAGWSDFGRELGRLIEGQRLLAEVLREFDNVEAARQRAEQAAAKAEARRESARASLDAAEAKLASLPEVEASASLAEERERLDASREVLARAERACRRQLEHAGLTERLTQLGRDIESARAAADDATSKSRAIEREMNELATQRRHAELAEYRAELRDGEACPLCGSLEHPATDSATTPGPARDERVVQREHAASIEAVATARERERAARDEVRSTEQQIAALDEATADDAAVFESVRAALADRDVPDPITPEWCAAADEALARDRDRIRLEERRLLERVRERELARAEVDRLRTAFTDAVRDVDESARDLRSRAERLEAFASKRADLEKREADAHRALDEMLAERRTHVDAAREALRATEAALATAVAARKELLGGRSVAEVESAARDADATLERRTASARETHVAASRAAASAQTEVEAAERQLEAIRREHAVASAAFADVLAQLGLESGGDSHARVREQRERAIAERDRFQVQRALDDKARAQVASLDEQIRAKRESSRPCLAVDELIGSSDGRKFRAFAQGLSFEHLLAQANRHLGELTPRYRLMAVPGEHLDLQIVDCEMGSEVRSIHSLSGGETFLVSLALALGLASMAAANIRFETLFIDEGLGTLDSESLETVLAALDALQATGYQVGVISHVDGLAERVGARVHVEKRGGGRSVVRIVDVVAPELDLARSGREADRERAAE